MPALNIMLGNLPLAAADSNAALGAAIRVGNLRSDGDAGAAQTDPS